jgi:hypothetical protein
MEQVPEEGRSVNTGSVNMVSGNARAAHALVLRWEENQPLPYRLLGVARPLGVLEQAPPWLTSGPADRPFDFCGHVRRLAADIVARCDSLGHIDVRRLLLCVTAARNRRVHGLQARVTPLRFAHGELTRRRPRCRPALVPAPQLCPAAAPPRLRGRDDRTQAQDHSGGLAWVK